VCPLYEALGSACIEVEITILIEHLPSRVLLLLADDGANLAAVPGCCIAANILWVKRMVGRGAAAGTGTPLDAQVRGGEGVPGQARESYTPHISPTAARQSNSSAHGSAAPGATELVAVHSPEGAREVLQQQQQQQQQQRLVSSEINPDDVHVAVVATDRVSSVPPGAVADRQGAAGHTSSDLAVKRPTHTATTTTARVAVTTNVVALDTQPPQPVQGSQLEAATSAPSCSARLALDGGIQVKLSGA
jgi:hypothetical protein